MNELFAEKYEPHNIKDYIGFNHNTILKYIERVLDGTEKKNGFIMWGQPGVGKTTLALMLPNHFNIAFHYTNASDSRKKKDVNDDIFRTTSLQSEKTLIVMDECDGLSKPAFKELEKVLKKYSQPTILICNELTKIPYSIRKLCHVEKFATDRFSMMALATKVSKSENLNLSREEIKDIVTNSKSYRDILHALQFGTSDHPPEQISIDTAILKSLQGQSKGDLPTNDLNGLIVKFNDSSSRPDLIATADLWNRRYVSGYTMGKYIVKAILGSIRNPGIKKLKYPRTYAMIHIAKTGKKMKDESTPDKKSKPKIRILGFK